MKSDHAKHRVTETDIFDNRLIFGDNLLALKALKALEAQFAGRVKCVFIDPPYNTGSAFEHYDDGVEHSIWLSLMRDRLEIIRRLLTEDGSLWITIDDNECHYLKVLCDEVFGRTSFVANVVSGKKHSPHKQMPFGSPKATTIFSSMLATKVAGGRIRRRATRPQMRDTRILTVIPEPRGCRITSPSA